MSATDRLSQFKNRGKDMDGCRRRRKEDVVQLRKARKDDQLNKRRNVDLGELGELSDDPLSPQKNNNLAVTDLEQVIQGLSSTDYGVVYKATQAARRILSKEKNPPIDEFIKRDTVPRFVQLLQSNDKPELQFEAAWALTNIASGTAEQTTAVVESGAITLFIQLLSSSSCQVCEQAVWALANIAGDGPSYRNLLIKQGIIPPLVNLVKPQAPSTFLANVAWCISNLCRNKEPPTPLDAIKTCLPSIKALALHDNSSVVSDACWSLSYISDGSDDRIQEVCDLGIIPRLIHIIANSNEKSLLVPALRTLGNIVTGSDEQTQMVIDLGALPAIRKLMDHDSLNMRKELAWTLSNITAGNQKQIQAVIDADLIEPIVEILRSGDFRSQKEATWAITNLTCGGSLDQIAVIVRAGVLTAFTALLDCEDSKIIMVVLDAFKNVLSAGDKMGQREALCEALEEMGMVDRLEKLQLHNNEDIYQTAVQLIEEYWSADEDEAALQPEANAGEYLFDANNGDASNINF